jgi:flavin-dependent dehydrogenase
VLARAGHNVIIVDKASFPRDKCCGDGLTTGALRHLEAIGLNPGDVPSWTPVDTLTLVSPSGRHEQASLRNGRGTFAAVARRIDLDFALLNLAKSAGVEVREGHTFQAIQRTDDGVKITLKSGDTISAPQIFAADGAWSPVRRAIAGTSTTINPRPSPGRIRDALQPVGEWHAYRTYVHGISAQASRALAVLFEPHLLPGYAWSFPVGEDTANVGICLRRTPGIRGPELARAWETTRDGTDLRALLGDNVRFDEPVRTWPIPAGIDKQHLSDWNGAVLYLGDAARAADPFTGEGVAQALTTALAAARAVIAGGARGSSFVATRYVNEIRTGLAREHQLAAAFSVLMTHRKAARAAVAFTGLHPWIGQFVGRWMFEDFPRLLAVQPQKWRRGALSSPGPFLDT